MGKKTNSKLKPSDVICPKCNGTGKGKSWHAGDFEITPECNHCYGEGKLDWIERVTGKQRRIFDYERVTAQMAEELSKSIDQEIMDNIIKDMEKEDKNDNRVFSEFVFRPSTEQSIKGETD